MSAKAIAIIFVCSVFAAALGTASLAQVSELTKKPKEDVTTEQAEQKSREQYYADFVYYLDHGEPKDRASTSSDNGTPKTAKENETNFNGTSKPSDTIKTKTDNQNEPQLPHLEWHNSPSQKPRPHRIWIAPDDSNW